LQIYIDVHNDIKLLLLRFVLGQFYTCARKLQNLTHFVSLSDRTKTDGSNLTQSSVVQSFTAMLVISVFLFNKTLLIKCIGSFSCICIL